jgi:hypothetical protein
VSISQCFVDFFSTLFSSFFNASQTLGMLTAAQKVIIATNALAMFGPARRVYLTETAPQDFPVSLSQSQIRSKLRKWIQCKGGHN